MTSYIDQHSNHKILKIRIKWALYGEKKPEITQYINSGGIKKRFIAKWEEQSRIAYLKEPEFKVGDKVYYMGIPARLIEKDKDQWLVGDYLQKTKLQYFRKESDLSHYYPGQQVESFKYVELIEKISKNYPYLNDKHKWQEAEEPEPMFVGKTKYHEPTYEPNPKYTQFQEDVDKGIILAIIKQ